MMDELTLSMLGGWVKWWQILLLVILIALIIFWKKYRSKQM
jgi:type II secretory pathway component PulF